jgi:hypothetical protein
MFGKVQTIRGLQFSMVPPSPGARSKFVVVEGDGEKSGKSEFPPFLLPLFHYFIPTPHFLILSKPISINSALACLTNPR